MLLAAMLFVYFMCSTLANKVIANALYKDSWTKFQRIKPQLRVASRRRNGRVFSSRLLLSEHELTFLIRGVDVIAVAHHGPDGLSQTVPVRLLGALIQQSVRHQARVASVLQILEKKKRNFFKIQHRDKM